MARKDLIAGNWKMNATHLEAIQMVQKLGYRLDPGDYDRVDVVVCPPFTALRSVQTVIETDYLRLQLGAQNVYWEAQGAFTGEVSAPMLARLGVKWVVVGHSERRHLMGETDEIVARKLRAVLAHGMAPIVAVGETLEQREQEFTEAVIGGQLRAALEGLEAATVASLVVAYEPVWAIGTGRTATPAQAQEVHALIRGLLRRGYGGVAETVRILYGGSMKAANARELLLQPDIDGGLIGGASLVADEFMGIVRSA
jgi:triosephosphate isomerase